MPFIACSCHTMSLLKYILLKKENPVLPDKDVCSSLSCEGLKLAGEKAKECLETDRPPWGKSE